LTRVFNKQSRSDKGQYFTGENGSDKEVSLKWQFAEVVCLLLVL
jgi:hypothetical protein